MLSQILDLAIMFAPEAAEGISEATGSLVESAGRRLAAGMLGELSERANGLTGAALAKMASHGEDLAEMATKALKATLVESDLELISKAELSILRELAAKAKRGEPISEDLKELDKLLVDSGVANGIAGAWRSN